LIPPEAACGLRGDEESPGLSVVALSPPGGAAGGPAEPDPRRLLASPQRRQLVLALGALALPTAARAGEAPWPGADWAAVDAAGWLASGLQAAADIARDLGSDALWVVHRGRPVLAFGAVDKPLPLYSVRKSVLGLLFGQALARGEVDLSATLAQLGIDDRGSLSEAERQATLQHLLQSRSGVYHGAAYETAQMAAERPRRGSHAPGSHWYYNNWDFNALGTIFGRRAGVDVFAALERDLARPLQFQDFDRATHTRWHFERVSEHGAYLIELSARDLARLGLLVARGGRWQGRPLLPEAWLADSLRPWSVAPDGWQGYGYLWWVPQRAWPFWTRAPGDLGLAWGNHGQLMWVDRARDLVIVHRAESRWWRDPIHPGRTGALLRQLLAAMPA